MGEADDIELLRVEGSRKLDLDPRSDDNDVDNREEKPAAPLDDTAENTAAEITADNSGMADAPLNPRSSGGGIGPIDLDASSAASDDSEETFEEPRFLCTPRGRLLTLFCVLVLAAVGIALGVTQPWNQGGSGAAPSSVGDDYSDTSSDYGPGSGSDWGSNYSQAPTPKPTYWWQASTTPAPTPIGGGQDQGSQPVWTTPAPNDYSTATPNPPPTPAPTNPPVGAAEFEKYRQLVNAILTAKVSPLGSFSTSAAVAASTDASTPQQAALNWLAFNDPLGLDAATDPAMRIIQRYSAAVLYYGTAGENWNDKTGWLGGQHECDWVGVTCQVKQILAHSEPQVQVTVEERMVTEITLNDNNLFGLIPLEIGAFPWMDTLGIYSNLLGGAVPTNIGNLTKLERLWLDDNYFQGTIPTEIGNMVALKQIDIFRNNFDGQLPTELGNLGNLTRFSAYDNKLTGTLPTELGNMKKLKELFLDTNDIGGSIPDELGGATELQDLRLFQNELSDAIPDGLSSLSNLKIFYADNNDLTGQIPATAVAGWTSLVDFQAFKNDLGGSLPEIFGALPELSVIALADNEIGGVLPMGICQQGSKLLKIDMSGNSLVGSIPNNIHDCSLLQRLHLDKNEMDSSIPTEIGQLGQLKSLHLNDNSFQGSIPLQLKDLASLEELHLESNTLVGSVPSQLCGQLQSAQADCEGVNAEVACTCCTLCCGQSGCLAPQIAPQLPARAFVP